ncbi:MAG: HipA domain-containing protein [Deltaproteobacteria bacterium]|nr:HipA domain-containing protein [Deltaproteobacteria bacterium]
MSAPLEPFSGLFGVFDDSLPDGGEPPRILDLDRLAQESREVLSAAAVDVLPELLRLGGSPHGAQPKVLVSLRPEEGCVVSTPAEPGLRAVLVKFRGVGDEEDAGPIEFAYHAMARAAGIEVPEAWLLPGARTGGFFAVERFDLVHGRRWHVHTLCGLLHADHRLPSLDDVGALAAVHRLIGDWQQLEQMFRRMVFNVLAHNRDAHTRQVSLRMDREGRWTLAPAYDLTFTEGPGGEHSMAVAGEGRPGRVDLLRTADQVGIARRGAQAIIDEVAAAVAGWPGHAASAGVNRAVMEHIRRHLP